EVVRLAVGTEQDAPAMLDEALAIFLEPQHQALARLLVAFSCFLRERRID
ncbi:hypothetical protein IH721_25850, partial [Escherichia coli]|nr:hypothetical protein [Escherichia coli]